MAKYGSPTVTPRMAAAIKRLLKQGLLQHQIAALYGINQGRVSEIKTGRCFGDVPPEE
jgi:predicted XRE-type DNA-binding protein